MNPPSQGRRRPRPAPGRKPPQSRRERQPVPWPWLTAALVMFAVAGLILVALPVPYWVWTLAFAAVLVQGLALAGPVALSGQGPWRARLQALLGIVGAAALAAALAIAMNYIGSAKLDEIQPTATAFQVLRLSLLALAIAAVCASLLSTVGDRLIAASFRRLPTTFIVSATGMLGMIIGGGLGLLLLGPPGTSP